MVRVKNTILEQLLTSLERLSGDINSFSRNLESYQKSLDEIGEGVISLRKEVEVLLSLEDNDDK
jgi:archaellum component FlaC